MDVLGIFIKSFAKKVIQLHNEQIKFFTLGLFRPCQQSERSNILKKNSDNTIRAFFINSWFQFMLFLQLVLVYQLQELQ